MYNTTSYRHCVAFVNQIIKSKIPFNQYKNFVLSAKYCIENEVNNIL